MKVSLLLNYDAKPGPSNVNKSKLDYRLYQPVELLFVCSLCHRHMIWLYAYHLYNKHCIKPGSFILCIDYFRWSLPKKYVAQSQMSSLFFMVDRELWWRCLMIMLIGTRLVAWWGGALHVDIWWLYIVQCVETILMVPYARRSCK